MVLKNDWRPLQTAGNASMLDLRQWLRALPCRRAAQAASLLATTYDSLLTRMPLRSDHAFARRIDRTRWIHT